MNSPGPLFESSDEAACNDSHAQDKSEYSSALPDATANTSEVHNTYDLDNSRECDATSQLPDTTLRQEATNIAQSNATSTNIYELPDETTVSMSGSNCVPDATNSSKQK